MSTLPKATPLTSSRTWPLNPGSLTSRIILFIIVWYMDQSQYVQLILIVSFSARSSGTFWVFPHSGKKLWCLFIFSAENSKSMLLKLCSMVYKVCNSNLLTKVMPTKGSMGNATITGLTCLINCKASQGFQVLIYNVNLWVGNGKAVFLKHIWPFLATEHLTRFTFYGTYFGKCWPRC